MKNIVDVFKEKQSELARLVKEVEALQIVLPLLTADSTSPAPPTPMPSPTALEEATNAVIHDIPPKQSKRWP